MTAISRSQRLTRRTVLGAASAAAGVLALAACGSSSDDASGGSDSGSGTASGEVPVLDEDTDVTITFMHAMSSGTQKPALEAIVAAFREEHPNVTVELQDQPDYGTLQTKTKAQVAAGTAPTIAQAYESWAAEYADSQVIVPLDAYAATSEDLAGFASGVVEDLKLPDGQTWMWPFNKSVVVVYRNAAMVPDAAATWDEFATAAKSASADGVVALSIDPGSAAGPAGGTALFEILAEAMGGPVFAADGTPQFDGPGPVAALEYLVDLKDAGALATGTGYPGQEALGAEKGAYDVSSVASYPFNLDAVGGKFEMAVDPLPEGSAGTANQLAGTNVVLFAAASDQERAAAWAFMTFLTSPQQQANWAEATGYLPVSSASLELEPLKTAVSERPWITDAQAQLDVASALPAVSTVQEAAGLLAVALGEALQGTTAPADALATAQQQASGLS
ncbi:extracellular solute-binding protein [Brachybacterium sp. DNPG3]